MPIPDLSFPVGRGTRRDARCDRRGRAYRHRLCFRNAVLVDRCRRLAWGTPFGGKSGGLGEAVRAFALAYSAALVYVVIGLLFNLFFGWNTAVAFGVTGVLWALGPMIAVLKGMVGGRSWRPCWRRRVPGWCCWAGAGGLAGMSALTKEQLLEILRDGSIALVCIITLNALCGGAVLAILATPLMLLCLLPLFCCSCSLTRRRVGKTMLGWPRRFRVVSSCWCHLPCWPCLRVSGCIGTRPVFASSGLMAVGAAIGRRWPRSAAGVSPERFCRLSVRLAVDYLMLFSALVANSLAGA